MRRTLPLLWGPLLAVLFAGPLVQRFPSWGESFVGRSDSAAPAKALLPFARLQRGLHFRPPLDRQGPSLGPALAVEDFGRIGSARVIVAGPDRISVPPDESARHFPLFPTGPPSHA